MEDKLKNLLSGKKSLPRKLRRREFLAASLLLGLPYRAGAWQQPAIDTGISGRGPSAIRLALPEFRPASADSRATQLARVFNEVLWNDLEFSGNIELASRSFYPIGNFSQRSDIRVEDWTKPGVEAAYIGFGGANVSGNQFRVSAQLLNLSSNETVIGKTYSGETSEELARLLAHTFADEILEKLGFGRGITKTRIAFVSDRSGHKEIYVMDYDGSNVYPLTSIRNIAIMPAWAPDGQKIAYAAWRGAGRPANIEIVSLAGQRLTFTQNESVTNSTPSWSPDGGSVAYSSGAAGTDIYVADWNGRSARRLTSAPQIDTSPFWNPATGRQIAFVSRRSGTPQIYTMESDGTNVQRVINDGGDAENPAWSPDGRLIAFAWQRSGSGSFDIYIHNLATGRNTQLTQNAGNNERPSWAPDGKHIAFQSNRTGTTQIYSMLADGKRVRQLTSTGRINEGPAWSGYVQ